MDGNKGEAERCLELAKRCISEGKIEQAEKYLIKSEKLYSTQKAKDLLEQLQRLKVCKPNPKMPEEAPSVRKRSNAGTKNEESTKEVEYTDDQLVAVKRIKKCKDYYEILGVSKEATDSDIKKAYKKLALSLHPDKNKAPGAAEAFKAIGNAVATLTDPEKRKQYDLFGGDEERLHQTHHYETYTRGFESDVTAEELFHMFFGGFPSGDNVYTRRGRFGTQWRRATDQTSQQAHRETSNYTVFMQMLPVLILIGLSMMSSLLVSDPVYSLTQTPKFPVARTTMNLKVPYYVKENFHTDYQGSMRRLEASVEEEFMTNLRNSCYREKSYRENLLWKARSFGDSQLFAKAQAIRTPSCDTYQEITSRNSGKH